MKEVFGKVTNFKSTNSKLPEDTRREFISLYTKIYGTPIVTNKEFMFWVVKGYIVEAKRCPINEAKVATYTAREKAKREST